MSEATTSTITAPKRLLRPLPSAGASRRVRKQPVDTVVQPSQVSATEVTDDASTPKASARTLPSEGAAFTFNVPALKVNDHPLNENLTSSTAVIDEAKDVELRKKFLNLQIQEPAKPMAPILRIPKKTKPPTAPVERPLAKVKAIDTAPKPQIVFGDAVTVFGESKNSDSKNDPETPNDNNIESFRAQKRRTERARKERLGLARDKSKLEPLPLPDPTIPLEERRKTQLPPIEDGEDDGDEREGDKGKKARQEIKRLAILMAKDVQMRKIPKSQLRAMAQGKTPEETAARTEILKLALRIVAKMQEKKQETATLESERSDEKPTAAAPASEVGEESNVRRKSKGKERKAEEEKTSTEE